MTYTSIVRNPFIECDVVFNIAHWTAWDDILNFKNVRGGDYWTFKCQVLCVYIWLCKGNIVLSILIYVWSVYICGQSLTIVWLRHRPHNILEWSNAEILVSILMPSVMSSYFLINLIIISVIYTHPCNRVSDTKYHKWCSVNDTL